jgi:hypothetical protein
MRNSLLGFLLAIAVAAPAAAGDSLVNPGFDGDTSGWTEFYPEYVVAAYSDEDAAGDPASGSVSVTNIYTGASAEAGYWQCVDVVAETEYRVGATVRIPSGQGVAGDAGVTLYWSDELDCSTWIGGASVDTAVLDVWTTAIGFKTAPTGARSVRVLLKVFKHEGDPLQAYIDDVVLEPVLFRDGFESGSLTEWSSSVPP